MRCEGSEGEGEEEEELGCDEAGGIVRWRAKRWRDVGRMCEARSVSKAMAGKDAECLPVVVTLGSFYHDCQS